MIPKSPTARPAMPPVVGVVGPTGSGKTALAIELARRFGGEIINTDSLQVYRYLNIGTAKPTPEEQAQASHHLLDVVTPDQAFSAGDYIAQASTVLERLATAGRVAILCGGTGLYFRALTEGIANVPPVPAEIRSAVEERMRVQGVTACHGELERLDPEGAARLHPNDVARISRALEVVLATGVPLSRYQRASNEGGLVGEALYVGLDWERSALYAHINQRVEAMLAEGWIDEVRGVLAQGYGADLKPLRSIGYREIAEFLAGARDEASMAPEIQQRTRNYAKRQMTWFRHQTRVDWFRPGNLEDALHRVERYLTERETQGTGTP